MYIHIFARKTRDLHVHTCVHVLSTQVLQKAPGGGAGAAVRREREIRDIYIYIYTYGRKA